MILNKKRCYPAGMFIATPLRIIAIIQLCLAFTVLIACIGYPFLGELFEIKTKRLLYEAVITKSDPEIASFLAELPVLEQKELEESYAFLQKRLNRPFIEKILDSIEILIIDIPLFKKAWIVFAIVISLLVLLKVEGAAQAAWILPLITIAYAFTFYNTQVGQADLFPLEQTIIDDYIEHPLTGGILEQKEQLTRGWHRYLVRVWGNEIPSEDEQIFNNQLKKGEFYFNLAKISRLEIDPNMERRKIFRKPEPLGLLLAYFLWNFYYAWCFIPKLNKRKFYTKPIDVLGKN